MDCIYYTIEEVADKLRVKKPTITKYLRDGVISGVKMGRVWRISEGALKEFIATGGKPSKKYDRTEKDIKA
jgi:excisionase family DNA binding protein